MHALFRKALEDLGLPYLDIRGGWEERGARAIRAIDARLAGRPETKA